MWPFLRRPSLGMHLKSANVWISSSCNHPNYSLLLTYLNHPTKVSNQFFVFTMHENLESLDTKSDGGGGHRWNLTLFTSSPTSTKRTINTREIKLCSININSIYAVVPVSTSSFACNCSLVSAFKHACR